MKTLNLKSAIKSLTSSLLFLTALMSASSAKAQTQATVNPTNIQISDSVTQKSVTRLGINLGDQSFWDSGQMMKNLTFRNPGFEGMKYRSILHCERVTANSCTDDNQWSGQADGYWNGGSYLVISGAANGVAGRVVSNNAAETTCATCGPTIVFDQNVKMAVGDYVELSKTFPGTGDAGWWDSVGGGGTISTEMNDLSPNTPGQQAILLNAAKAGQTAGLTQYFDSYTNLSFIQMNGSFEVTFRAKGISGNNKLAVSVQRAGGGTYLSQTVTLTNSWQDFTLVFSASETGSAVGTIQMSLNVAGASVELDDVSLVQSNSSAYNPTAFRDDVVNALKELNPGTIRMMASGAALGSDIQNQLAVPFARMREGYSTYGSSQTDVSYGIHEFLQLCQTVGADPWITIPTGTTPQEMAGFIQYLTGDGSDSFSALRLARGQAEPWTSVFKKIHIELGNETWNGTFLGESMTFPGYPQWANQVFGNARKTSGYVASKFDLVLDGWSSVPWYNQQLLSYSNQQDSIDMAPYLLYSANNESQPLMFGALFAEPEMFNNSGGIVALNLQAAAAAKTNLNVYETNLSPLVGTVTQAQLNALTPSIGAGIGATNSMMQMMRSGVQIQNSFSLPQYNFIRGDGKSVKLWGTVVDMGTTKRKRPQFITEAMANAVIGGNMLQTTQLGTNPTWNQPLSSDSVQLSNAHYLQSFAFLNSGTASVVIFNLNLTTALPVSFSGANAPTGTVQMTQVTSTNITDNNETSDVIEPTTQTLSGFNPANSLSLPPFSMTVLTWGSAVAQAPQFSVVAGNYSDTQTVSMSDTTAGAAIHYTTDGSTPTSTSNLYTSAVTVSSTTTLNAIAIAAAFTNSPVTTALYTIQPIVATPTISVPTGSYSSAQTVTITTATAGASIYYTTNGTVPTTSSSAYAGPITVSSTETLEAIAAKASFSNSPVATAVYTFGAATPVPTFSIASGSFTSTQTVSIVDSITSSIYYTTDGTTPTSSSSLYSSAITVSSTETLKAIAIAKGDLPSAVAMATYTISTQTAQPAFNVQQGTFNGPQTVALTDATYGAVIYYTTNGTTPTTASTVYSTPINVNQSEYLEAAAIAPGFKLSTIAAGMYNLVAATPVISVPAGTYSGTQTVSISDTTPKAVLFYTTNGTAPTTTSTVYSGPIKVGASETLQVIAGEIGYANSAVVSSSYIIQSQTTSPSFSVAGGTFSGPQTVTIATSTAGATIYYTMDGSIPTTSSSVYSSSVTVNASETLQANAIAGSQSVSNTSAATFNLVAATPVINIASGTYNTAQTITLTSLTPGAMLYYTTNGSGANASSILYTGPFAVNASESITVIAAEAGYTSSMPASATYTIVQPAAAPTFAPAAGTYTAVQLVTIKDVTQGAVIYYTLDGSTPTTFSAVYQGAILVSSNQTINAIAVMPGATASSVGSVAYVISLQTAINMSKGFSNSLLRMNGSSALSGKTLQLTNGQSMEAGSGWYPNRMSVKTFVSSFDVQLPTSGGNGFTFTMQNDPTGTNAVGTVDSGLGYAGINKSVAVAFGLLDANQNAAQSIGVYTDGVVPQGTSVSLAGSGIDLQSGDLLHVQIAYAATVFGVTVTDKATGAMFTQTFNVDLGAILGTHGAYAGFTGSTGDLTSVQSILDWTYSQSK